MHLQLVQLLGALPLLSLATPVQRETTVHEKRDLSSPWTKRARLPPDVELPVRISLTQSNLEHGQASLLAVSDPLSLDYGKHWTSDQVKKAFAPSSTTIQNAMDWLSEAGISRSRVQQTSSLGALTFTATIDELEKLSRSEYYLYDNPTMGGAAIGCDEYHVPAQLQGQIDFISPGVALHELPRQKGEGEIRKRSQTCSTNGAITKGFEPLSQLPKSFPLEKCSDGITPQCIEALYGVPENVTCHAENSIGIFAFLASYLQEDLDAFFSHIPTKVPAGSKPDYVSIDGFKQQTEMANNVLNFEADLDVEMAWSLVYPTNITFYGVGGTKTELAELAKLNKTSPLTAGAVADSIAFENMLSAFDSSFCDNSTGTECGTLQAPKVLSISYGPQELYIPEAMAKRMCNEFMKLGLQGTTVVVASGDGGLAPQLLPGMCYGPDDKIFNPSVLASCPWVTVVGGTEMAANSSISSPQAEIVANQSAPGLHNYSPGSGFSNYFTAPAYQQKAVQGYFQKNPSPYPSYHYNGSNSSIGLNGGLYNEGGRAYPDVAALSANIYTVAGGPPAPCFGLDGGTSYAAPIFAGIVTRLNGERLAAGKSSIGFINPALYSHPDVMNDITQGHNYGCGTEGFAASEGWDMVSGLGTPNYPKMNALFMSLP